MVEETGKRVLDLINELYYGNFIDEMTKKCLCQTPTPPRIPIFYILTKGVDKTWGRPWPWPWCRLWPTLWPTLWLTLWPTGGQFFFNTRLSIAINLCKQCAPSMCHIYNSVLLAFCPLSGVSLKFSKLTRGRWESAKQECRVNATFRQLPHERAIIIKHLPRISER